MQSGKKRSFHFISATWQWWKGHPTWALLILVAAAILFRLALLLATGKNALTWGDEIYYDRVAKTILTTGCFCDPPGHLTVLRPPLYPWLIAGVYKISSGNWMLVVLLQVIFSGLTAGLVAIAGQQLTGSFGIGQLAGWIFAVHPVSIFTASLLYSETFYLFLLMMMVILWIGLIQKPREWLGLSLLSGAILGIANLMRPNLIVFPLLLFLALWGAYRKFGTALRAALVVAGAMLVFVLPWTIRNYQATGRLIPISANSGLLLMQGNNDMATGTGVNQDEFDPMENLDEADKDAAYWKVGMDWIRANPGRFLALLPQKAYKFFAPLERTTSGSLENKLAPVLNLAFGVLYLLALIGLIKTFARWREWLIIYFLILLPLGLALVFFGGTRYGLPVQPFVCLLAGVGLAWLPQILRKPKQT